MHSKITLRSQCQEALVSKWVLYASHIIPTHKRASNEVKATLRIDGSFFGIGVPGKCFYVESLLTGNSAGTLINL